MTDNDAIRNYWGLTEIMRCRDPWYNEFLTQCRNGNLTRDMYSFFNGLPTFTSPLDECTCNDDVISDPLLGPVMWHLLETYSFREIESFLAN